MTEAIHPVASSYLPSFITGPGETDVLMIAMSVILVLFVLMVGVFYFRLHALPDRFAHKKVQFEIVCVLGLIAMFTHMHIFWIAGLLLAMIDFPDFATPLKRIAGSVEKIALPPPSEPPRPQPTLGLREGGAGPRKETSMSSIYSEGTHR